MFRPARRRIVFSQKKLCKPNQLSSLTRSLLSPGICLDLDLQCLRPLDPLRQFDFIAVAANPTGISNGFLMVSPRHPFLEYVIQNLPRYNINWLGLPYATVMFSTGCHFLSYVSISNMISFDLMPTRQNIACLVSEQRPSPYPLGAESSSQTLRSRYNTVIPTFWFVVLAFFRWALAYVWASSFDFSSGVRYQHGSFCSAELDEI